LKNKEFNSKINVEKLAMPTTQIKQQKES